MIYKIRPTNYGKLMIGIAVVLSFLSVHWGIFVMIASFHEIVVIKGD